MEKQNKRKAKERRKGKEIKHIVCEDVD